MNALRKYSGLILFFTLHACSTAAEKPNFILILTDDQGYGDLGAHGNPFLKTPNLDQLYREGARFTNFVVSPTCAPTRCALMTGMHEFRSGVTHTVTGSREMSLNATTVVQVLKAAGYATGIFGKWHLGSNGEYRPEKRGDDHTVVIVINDNGGTWGVDNYNAGMRGCKGTAWYGGTRALSLWRWPGHIKPGNIGNLAAHVDLLPSLAEMAGAVMPEKLKDGLDGVSLCPLLLENKKTLPDRMVISHLGRWPDGEGLVETHKYAFCSVHWNNYLLVKSQTCGRADCRGECRNFRKVMEGHTVAGYSKKADFHYAVNLQGQWALYNVQEDLAQRDDLAGKFPEIVDKMSGIYEKWWTEVVPYIYRVAEGPRWSQN